MPTTSFPSTAVVACLADHATLQGRALSFSHHLPLRERKCLPSPSGWLIVPNSLQSPGLLHLSLLSPWGTNLMPPLLPQLPPSHINKAASGLWRHQSCPELRPLPSRNVCQSLVQDTASHCGSQTSRSSSSVAVLLQPLDTRVEGYCLYVHMHGLVFSFKKTHSAQFLNLYSLLKAVSLQRTETCLEPIDC